MRAASKDGGRVYILVDEYDRVCNKLMMENPKAYKSMVSEDVARAASLPINNIYDHFKKLAFKNPELRTFSIRITPVAMADATGAETVADLSRSRTFADMLGFRRDAVVSAIRRVPGLNQKQQSLVLRRLQRFYNGYRHLGSDGTLFHPKMCVNCLARMVEDQQYRMKVSDPDTSAMDQLELLKAIDVDTSHSAMSMVLSQQHLTAALEQDKWVTSGTLEDSMRKRRQVEVRLAPFMQKLRFAALLSQDDSAVLSVGTVIERVRVFLYFQGLLTVAEERKVDGDTVVALWLSNIAFVDSYLARVVPSISACMHGLIDGVLNPTSKALKRGVQSVVGHPDGPLANLQYFNESSFQAAVCSCLRLAVELVGVSATIEAENVLDSRESVALAENEQHAKVVAKETSKGKGMNGNNGRDKRKDKRGDMLIFVDGAPTALLELKLFHRSKVHSIPGYTGVQRDRFLSPASPGRTVSEVLVIDDVELQQAVLKTGFKINLVASEPAVASSKDSPFRVSDVQKAAARQALLNYQLLCLNPSMAEQRTYEAVRVLTLVMIGYRVLVEEVSTGI